MPRQRSLVVSAAVDAVDSRPVTAACQNRNFRCIVRAEFQTQSEARIQLSRTNEYFPGTSERIMMISGTVNQVLTALHLVLAKMNSEKTVQETMLARCGGTGVPLVSQANMLHSVSISEHCVPASRSCASA